MAILAKTVYVRDPKRQRDIVLRAGEEPAPEYAALVRNPDAWEGGQLPDQATDDSGQDDAAEEDTAKAAPAAKKTAARKTAAASKPARGRDAADEGSSGE